jgi:hypothetical protein
LTSVSATARQYSVIGGNRLFGAAVGLWLAVSVMFCVGLTFVDEFFWPLVVVLAVPLLLLYLSLPICAAVLAVCRLKRSEYQSATFLLFVPVVAIYLLFRGPSIGAFIRFTVEYPNYMARIDAARAGSVDFEIVSGSPIVAFFPWGGTAVNSYGVVFDESDVIARPLSERQQAWRYRAVPGELLCSGSAWRLSGHFYMGHFAC